MTATSASDSISRRRRLFWRFSLWHRPLGLDRRSGGFTTDGVSPASAGGQCHRSPPSNDGEDGDSPASDDLPHNGARELHRGCRGGLVRSANSSANRQASTGFTKCRSNPFSSNCSSLPHAVTAITGRCLAVAPSLLRSLRTNSTPLLPGMSKSQVTTSGRYDSSSELAFFRPIRL